MRIRIHSPAYVAIIICFIFLSNNQSSGPDQARDLVGRGAQPLQEGEGGEQSTQVILKLFMSSAPV